MDLPVASGIRKASPRLAEQAVADAVRSLCRGGTWQGIARELAWRAVTVGGRELRSLEQLCVIAEERLAHLVDEAMWPVEQAALHGWDEYLASRPHDARGALTAAKLDAGEEAGRLMAAAYASVLDALVGPGAEPRSSRRRLALRPRRDSRDDPLAA